MCLQLWRQVPLHTEPSGPYGYLGECCLWLNVQIYPVQMGGLQWASASVAAAAAAPQGSAGLCPGEKEVGSTRQSEQGLADEGQADT